MKSKILITASLLMAATAGCGKKDSKNDKASDPPADDGGPGNDPADAGVSDKKAVEGEVAIAGQISLDLSLTETAAPDKVVAFMTVAGKFQSGNDGQVKSDIKENGTFKVALPVVNPQIKAIEASEKPDGTYDREKLSAAIGKNLDSSITDADIKQHLEEMKSAAANGGISYAVVAYKSSDDRFAEADSMQFIGLPNGDQHLKNLPMKFAKGDMSFGKVTPGAKDEATSELNADDSVFDLPAASLSTLASTSNALKVVKNRWMNTLPSGESYNVTPFFMWTGNQASAIGKYSDVASTPYGGMGMYVGMDKAPFTFDDICNKANAGKLKLIPPVEIDAGQYGKINATNPFDNGELGDIKDESSRKNCNGSKTGFYGAGQPGSNDIMVNWGTGGSIVGGVPEGKFKLQWGDTELARFELASSSPIDADGKPRVFVPALNVTKDAAGKITRLDVKLYKYEGGQYAEVTDLSVVRQLVSSVNVEMTQYSNNGSTDVRYSLLKDGSNELSVSEFKSESDGGDGETLTWYVVGSTVPQGAYAATSIAVYYEMFDASFRTEFRNE